MIYRDRDDYGLFLRLLKEVQNRYPFVLQAYCLMTNHFHLELTTVNDPIWKIMQPGDEQLRPDVQSEIWL